MSWFSNIFSGSIGTVIDSVGNAIDNLVTSDEEKLNLKKKDKNGNSYIKFIIKGAYK